MLIRGLIKGLKTDHWFLEFQEKKSQIISDILIEDDNAKILKVYEILHLLIRVFIKGLKTY